jgi:RNA polymerase sigma-70 factor (ECF subfamily)
MRPTVESIWTEFASKLRNFIRSRVGDHAAAEDILQEVFLKVHRKLPTLRASERLEAWIWRITRNSIVDHFRREHPNEPLTNAVSSAADEQATLPDLTPCVRRFIAELAPNHREALLLTEWQGLTQEKMARRLGISLSGAKSRVQRARNQLKEILLDCCRFELDSRGNILAMQSRKKPGAC